MNTTSSSTTCDSKHTESSINKKTTNASASDSNGHRERSCDKESWNCGAIGPEYAEMVALSSQWAMNSSMRANTACNISMNPNLDMSATSAGMNPYRYMGMTSDPNLYGMGNYAPYNMLGTVNNCIPRIVNCKVINLSKCTLYPPGQDAPNPYIHPKPLGCKTVFVCGFPENTAEEIVREVFERCGEISSIKMSKNSCLIRFSNESSVDSAITFSSYYMKINNKDDVSNTGRLHVDYAQAREDLYEYECRMGSVPKEAQQCGRIEQSSHPHTPPPVVHYSDHEAAILNEKLRSEEMFLQAMSVLITWLERGECNKRNAGYFYSMIQSSNSHVHRLMTEKSKYEDELNKAKMIKKQQMHVFLLQFDEIAKVFKAAKLQKVWDHFTKAQRKNIELWKQQVEMHKNDHVKEVLNDRIEDEMDLSDDDDDDTSNEMDGDEIAAPQQINIVKHPLQEEVSQLKEENDMLRARLKTSEKIMELEVSERKEEKSSDDYRIKKLRQTINNIKKHLTIVVEESDTDGGEKNRGESSNKKDLNKAEGQREKKKPNLPNPDPSPTITPADAHMIGLIATFLHVHPFGASIDYICSYLQNVDSTVHTRDVETLMRKFPDVFKEESTGIGASLEKKWTFGEFRLSQQVKEEKK